MPRWILIACLATSAMPPQSIAADVDYARDIRPILRDHCQSCHGPVKQKGGLRLDTGMLILKGGKGGPVLHPGSPGDSGILSRVLSDDDSERMPPEGARLSSGQVDLIRKWIQQGAAVPEDESAPARPEDHWAFQTVARSEIPSVKNVKWPRNPIDRFVLARLEAKGWKPAAAASPSALLRRAHLDLLGFPPSPEEQRTFSASPTPEALDRVIDQLLARPAYGERWARHWLDLVRYAETNGYERDAIKPMVWRYRDYVIRALNNDKPYDRFLHEQLAGDELPDATSETMIATGFYRLGHWDDEPADPQTDRFDQLDDIINTTSQSLLGLTLACARCHDHKFEPLTSKDYYSLLAVFDPLSRPRKGRTELTVPAGSREELKHASSDLPQAYVLQEKSPKAPDTRILIRGSATRPGAPVTPAVPDILARRQPDFPEPDSHTTRRRLGLARWIIDEQNPLTARVIVNHVWRLHFGQGLVRTAGDFGLMGEAPTHPELLDWLAHWFMRDAGWSLKELHRLILTSATWRMNRENNEAHAAEDPDNRLLWRMPYRRLEVEALRDSMLAVSGRMNREMFGPSMYPAVPPQALEGHSDPEKIWKPFNEKAASRRTVYAFIKRSMVVPMLEVLDLCDTTRPSERRAVTTVATQALTLFNGDFVNRQARHLADRLRHEVGNDSKAQVERAYRLALCRNPTKTEVDTAANFLEGEAAKIQQEARIAPAPARSQALTQFCRALLNLNEFAYPE